MNYKSKKSNYYKLVSAITYVFISLLLAILIIEYLMETVNVEGNSMMPTIHNKDKIVVEKLSYNFREPAIGDLIIFKYPADTRERIIKRIVALEGNHVKIENNKLFVDGKYYKENYLLESKMTDFNEIRVPSDTVFVLGDNRNNSVDSRSPDIGFVSKKVIVGRSLFRIYPFESAGRLK